MWLFNNKYNIEIDPNLLDELKDYVEVENIKSTIENLIKNYIEQKKPAMSANQEKVARNLKNWLRRENSEYRKIICSFFETQDSDGRVLKGKMHEYCEKNECTHFVTYFSQLTNSTIQQGKIFEENKYGYVNLADDVKDMIVDFYKQVSDKDINYSAQNVNLDKESEDIHSKSSDDIEKPEAIALLRQKNYTVHSCVTFASTNARTGQFWANPNPEFLKQDWSFILNDKKKRKLYLLNIPKNTFKSENISLKSPDYELLDIRLDPHTLINTAPDKTNFAPHKIAEISY